MLVDLEIIGESAGIISKHLNEFSEQLLDEMDRLYRQLVRYSAENSQQSAGGNTSAVSTDEEVIEDTIEKFQRSFTEENPREMNA